ncbi:hypothetical protein [Bradyrhizobium elkanii]
MREYEALRAACEATIREYAGTHARMVQIRRQYPPCEYEALRAAMETIISENKGVVGRVKRALDQVAAMETTSKMET